MRRHGTLIALVSRFSARICRYHRRSLRVPSLSRICTMSKHDAGEGEVVKAFECDVESFVVAGNAAEASGPGEAAFDDPTARQENEAAFGHEVLDNLQPDAVLPGGLGRGLAGVALIDIGQIHRVAGHLLHLFGQRGYQRQLDLRVTA